MGYHPGPLLWQFLTYIAAFDEGNGDGMSLISGTWLT